MGAETYPLLALAALLALMSVIVVGLSWGLRRSERRFQALFHWSVDAAFLVAPDGRILDANRSVKRDLGYRPEEVEGKPILDLIDGSGDETCGRMLDDARMHGAVVVSHSFRHADGRVIQMDLTAVAAPWFPGESVIVTARPVWDRQHAEGTLRDSEQRFRFLSQVAREAVVVHDNGHIVLANGAYYAMFGYVPEELAGTDAIEKTVPPGSLADIRTRVRRGEEAPYETWGVRRDGTHFPIRITGTENTYNGRRVRVSLIRDITDEHLARDEREQLIAELGGKNAELERFTYTVSHDLKAPLVTIAALCDLLGGEIGEGRMEEATGRLNRIRAAADRMRALLDGLLELSRVGREASRPARVSLGPVIERTLSLLEGRIVQVGAEIDVEGNLPDIYGEPLRIQQVFQNLIDNALRFMGDQPSPRLAIFCESRGPEVVIRVSDNGSGIEPAMLERVFGLFVQGGASGEGTGVGLALVRRILEQHGGSVHAESEGCGTGTSIVLRFPLVPTDGDVTDERGGDA